MHQGQTMGSGQSNLTQSPVGMGATQFQQTAGAPWASSQTSIATPPQEGFGIDAEQQMDIVTRFINKEVRGIVLPALSPLKQESVSFTWDMDVLYLHRDLPAHRTCQTERLEAELCMQKKK